jgi:hypothetical protein
LVAGLQRLASEFGDLFCQEGSTLLIGASFVRPLGRKEALSMRILLLRVAYLCAVAAEGGVVTTPTSAAFDDAVRSHAKPCEG